MDTTLAHNTAMTERNKNIAETISRERARLRNFIRRRVPDSGDAEDILQEVFYELVESYRLPQPIEQVGAWMFRVARNRITDLFRKNKPERLPSGLEAGDGDNDTDVAMLEDLLPAPDAGPEAAYARAVLLAQVYAALDELPEEQRAVFVAHELEGRNFKELAAESGLGVNTLLSRKRYAVLYLRERLRTIHDDFMTN